MVRQNTALNHPRHSARLTTYERLKALILTGQLRPTERLSETRLADRLGVSRTPLREALVKLEEEGLVIGQRNVGYTVTDLNVEAVRDLLIVREVLDVCAAELACKTATEEDFARIRKVIAQMREIRRSKRPKPADIARELDLGIKIHVVIAEATRNQALIKMSEQIYQQLQLALWLEVLWVERPDDGLAEHKAIARAILARDSAAAARAARNHVRSSIANMAKVHEIYQYRRSAFNRAALPVATPSRRRPRAR